jgi:hypothetical protein
MIKRLRISICKHCRFSAARRYPGMYDVLPSITFRGVFRTAVGKKRLQRLRQMPQAKFKL